MESHMLLAAGAGAGLSAAFNAPLAGILFVMEEMRPQFRYNFLSVQSVLIATATADVASQVLMGRSAAIAMAHLEAPPLESLWLFVVFGSIIGLFGFLFNWLVVRALDGFQSLPKLLRGGVGLWVGGALGAVGWWMPMAIGGGNRVLPEVLQHHWTVQAMMLLCLIRFGTFILSYGAGSPGGLFTPMLTLGVLFGLGFGEGILHWKPGLLDRPDYFAIAGMAALFSSTVRAPVTGIVLAIEMTGNYSQILPLILTNLSATFVAEGLGGKPIYTVLLRRTLERSKAAVGAAQAGDV
jgi:CIC family chloride channel protein